MAEKIYRGDSGTLRVQGWEVERMDRAAQLGFELAREPVTQGQLIAFDDLTCWLKASPLIGWTSWRHGMRRTLLARRVPRINEYFNLSWLIERHFQAVLPIAAGVLLARGLPRFQFLLTREVPRAKPLDIYLESTERGTEERAAVLAELAREVARLHALGFVHRDLYARNFLVAGAAEGSTHGRRLWILDAWAGGRNMQWRGAAHDLACLFLQGADLLSSEEQGELLARYFKERAVQGRPARKDELLADVVRHRATLLRQLENRPARRRGRELPRACWDPRDLDL